MCVHWFSTLGLYPSTCLAEIRPQSGSPSSNFNLFAFLAILHRIGRTQAQHRSIDPPKTGAHAPCHLPIPTRGSGWLCSIGSDNHSQALARLGGSWRSQQRVRGCVHSVNHCPGRPGLPGYHSALSSCSAGWLICTRYSPGYCAHLATGQGIVWGKSQVLPRFGEFHCTKLYRMLAIVYLDSGEAAFAARDSQYRG